MSTLKNKYRRLCDYVSFDNYFKFNIKKSSINNSEIDYLIKTINHPESFNSKLVELFKVEPHKMIDFINYWDSSFNREKRTKDNTLCLIKNFLSFTDNDLIQFLDKNDIFFLISKNFIREFNNDNQNKITLDDIYKIIYETISCIDNNLYFFVYFIFCQYKFPINNPPKLEKVDSNETYTKVINLLKNNIKKEKLINCNKSLFILDYSYRYLDLKDFVVNLINEIFSKNEFENLLQILLTAKSLQSRDYIDDYASIKEFFANIAKEKELKEILLDIYYDLACEKYKTDNKYVVSNRYEEKKYIIEVVLDFYYNNKLVEIKSNADINNDNKSFEERISNLNLEFKKYSDKEIKYSIETPSSEKTSLHQICDFIRNVQIYHKTLYDKYYTEKFDLFKNIND